MKFTVLLTLFFAALSVSHAQTSTGLSQSRGLTESEKTAILDEHNRLRTQVASGQVPGQPPAADMTRLEWSDTVAQHAQTWAENCQGPQMGGFKRYGEGQIVALDGDREMIIKQAFKMWFDEAHPEYRYGSESTVSTYSQLVSAYSKQLGCGASSCKGYPYARLICNYFIAGNNYGVQPYESGPSCSKCPSDYAYCKDSLCTSSRVCNNGDSYCRCTVDPNICNNNGYFDLYNCKCNCNKGYTGLNCDKICEDPPIKQCLIRAREGECKPSEGNAYYSDMILSCPAACGKCEAMCQNRRRDCADLKAWGNCESTREYMEIFCAQECRYCQ